MPVDPYSRSMIKGLGNSILITETGYVISGQLASFENGTNAASYISHFATCPYASGHRR